VNNSELSKLELNLFESAFCSHNERNPLQTISVSDKDVCDPFISSQQHYNHTDLGFASLHVHVFHHDEHLKLYHHSFPYWE